MYLGGFLVLSCEPFTKTSKNHCKKMQKVPCCRRKSVASGASCFLLRWDERRMFVGVRSQAAEKSFSIENCKCSDLNGVGQGCLG